jgi:hypothetical protein
VPNLDFQITGVEAAARGMAPALNFHLSVNNRSLTEEVRAVMLQVEIQVQSNRRGYNAREKEKLTEIFGPPERWTHTLRNRLWAVTHAKIGRFSGNTKTILPVVCTFDLNVTAAKYFYAIEDGPVPLLFTFSGTTFYATSDGWLQTQQIPTDKQCVFPMPPRVWREAIDEHFPNCAWLYLQRDIFDRLCAFKRSRGLASWDETIDRLLAGDTKKESRRKTPAREPELPFSAPVPNTTVTA